MNTKKLLLSIALAIPFVVQAQVDDANVPYRNPNLTPEQRADDLLKKLTIEEKVALMQNASPAIERLGILPYEWWNEALHGVARAGVATVFPQTIGMAASFDNDLVYNVFNAVSDEGRAKHKFFAEQNNYRRYQGLTFWTPNINIFRDPRWGRGQETYGEDPYLTSQMGIAVVRGLQGEDTTRYNKAHACAKHYAVHSGPEWCRHSFDANEISSRDLRETYLPAFKDLVQKAHVKEIMCAYNAFDGDPCCGSNRLLTQILRNEWGFNGIVVSDCGAINDFYLPNNHHTHPDAKSASAAAVLSGTDIECGGSFAALVAGVKDGTIEEEAIDISVRRLLKARFELGIMDSEDPFNIPMSVVASDEHAALARKIAQESIVLLQNKNNALPLNRKMTIAIVGPNAQDSIMQWGNYNGTSFRNSTLLSAMREQLPEARIIYEPLCSLTDDYVQQSLWNECKYNGQVGFSATYWNKGNFEGEEVVTTQESTPLNFNTMGATAFAAGVNLQNFSCRYKSTFMPSHSGKAMFKIIDNGKIEIFINGERIFVTDRRRNFTNSCSFDFVAGNKYEIEMTFNAMRNDSELKFDIVEDQKADIALVMKKLRKADAIIFAGGISSRLEGEEMRVNIEGFKGGDRTDIELPKIQREMLAKLATLKKRLIFVNYSGSAMALVPESKICDAIVQAWYPGQEGGHALVDVLLGDYNPAGRLPITFYKSVSQLPDFLDYSMKGRTYRYMTETPLFCFGHGLSYTTFAYGKVEFDRDTVCYGQDAMLNVELTNTGQRDGEEVVQVYIRRTDDPEGPNKALRAFQRVALKKGETKKIKINMPIESFQWFDTKTERMRPLAGRYEVLVGGTSDDSKLIATHINFE